MIIISTSPCRLSLFGGGTDINPYCDLYSGLTINMAINLRQKLTVYFDKDIINFNNGKGGPNIFPTLANPNFYYTILKEFGLDDMHQIKFKSECDGIIESGLGSSAAAAVSLLGVINKKLNLKLSLDQIAHKAWELEVKKIGLFGGKQDQYIAAFGGVNIMEFKDGKVDITPLAKGFIEPLFPYLCLFYTGENRQSALIQEEFRNLTQKQIEALDEIKKLAVEAIDPITQGDFKQVGYLLNKAWEFKKASNKGVTNKRIDEIYSKALKAGALGGKIMGAGGGGFILFICPIWAQVVLKERLREMGCEWWDFSPCFQGLDVRILPDE